RDCVEADLAVGWYEDTSQLLRTTERHLAAGYKRLKIKIARGSDIELVRAMRKAFGDDLPLMVDANGDYTLEHIDVFRQLDVFNLMMIEQPLAGPAAGRVRRIATAVTHCYLPRREPRKPGRCGACHRPRQLSYCQYQDPARWRIRIFDLCV